MMELTPCSFRRVAKCGAMRCALVQQILGLADSEPCRVQPDACRACGRLESPQASRPNAVVASLVYNLARQIRQASGRPDCDEGQAWQAERYVFPNLAEEADKRSAARWSPTRWSPAFRLSLPFFTPRRALLKRRRNCAPLIGLIGRAVASGLGYLNYDLAEQGAVDAWLVVDPPQLPALDLPAERCRVERLRDMRDEAAVRRWLSRLDWVVWAESSPLVCVVRLAQQMGVRTACIPMWEWTSPTASWLRCVDLLICPVRHAYGLFQEWRRRFDFRWRVAYFPWPVAVERFPFRLRQRRRRCVFINGRGGAWAGELETDRRLGPRKGLDLVLAAARLTPEVSWTIFTQAGPPIAPPPNVEVREGPVERAALYEEGDVCVQPSRWEGLGLPLLECQAAGMPLVTVDAAPMNEHRPLRCAAPEHWTWGSLVDGQPLRIPEVSPEALAHTIRELQDEEIRAGSEAAHHWIRRERSWRGAVETWRRLFASSVCETL